MKNTAEIKKIPPSSRLEHWSNLLSEGVSILTFIAGAAVLVGWAFDIGFLKSVFPGLVTMKANTAFCFMLAGVALWFSQPGRVNTRSFRVISGACFFFVAFVGLLTLSEYLFGWNLGIDQLLFKEPAGAVHTINLGRMAPDTAVCFVLFAVGSWIVYGMSKNRRLILTAGLTASLILIVFALSAVLSYSFLGFVLLGWGNLTPMALHTALIFLALGTMIILETLRGGSAPRISRFSKDLLVSGVLVVILTIIFVLYIQSKQQENYAQTLRYQSFLLADELRQSGDDLTRMVRTHVVTGDPVYKRHFQDILDIRDGKKPWPKNYERPYWDLVLGDGPAPRGDQQAISLLELMRHVGFTEEEFRKLAEAKVNSDALTTPEFEAMKLVESLGPESKANRDKAIQMLHDKKYHEAKYGVMKPIDECIEMIDLRTLAVVKNANYQSRILQWIFITFGMGLILMLFRTYAALLETLGDSLDNVYLQIRKIGTGDFSSSIEIKDSLKNSVIGWLFQTQTKLRAYSDERKKAEEALKEAKAFTERTLNSITDIFYSFDLSGKFLSWNKTFSRISGYSDQELSSKKPVDFFLGEDIHHIAEAVERIYKEGTSKADANFVLKDGRQIPYEFTGSIFKDDKGNIIGFSGTGKDITERKKAEEAIAAAKDYTENIIKSMFDTLIVINPDGKIRSINEATAVLLGYKEEDLIGKPFGTIVAEEEEEEDIFSGSHLEKLIKEGSVKDYVLSYKAKDGRVVPMLLSGAIMRRVDCPGGVPSADCPEFKKKGMHCEKLQGIVIVAKDITERKKAEDALKEAQEQLFQTSKLASLGQLSAGAAHEINNPLAGIVGFTEATLLDLKNERIAPERIAHDLKIILKNAKRCMVIISNLLNFARAKELQRQESDINSLIDDAMALVKYKTAAQNIKVVKKYEKNPRKVSIDQDQMMQVLINVISNAQNAMPDGGELLVRTGSEDNFALIEVKDTGIGIEKENLLKVFDPFFTTREPGQGVGLGLSISYSIMKRHEGSIEAKSDGKNKGASFIIKIPV